MREKASIESWLGPLRWILAVALLAWLFSSGKLSGLSDLSRLFDKPIYLIIAALLLVVNYILNFFRWDLLLRGIQIRAPFPEIVRLSMIGQFFSIFMPGAVGGDLIKAVYVAREYPLQKTNGVASILLDRVLGFLTLLLFATFFFLMSFDAANLPGALQGFGTLLFAGTLVLLASVLLPGRASLLLEKIAQQFHLKHQLLHRVIRTLKSFSRSPGTLLLGLIISFVSQGCALMAAYFIGRALYGELPWGTLSFMKFISATAVGTTATALPIAPMGLGVGQVAMGKVFKLLGAPAESYGIVIISASQILMLAANLSGALWFLKSKKTSS